MVIPCAQVHYRPGLDAPLAPSFNVLAQQSFDLGEAQQPCGLQLGTRNDSASEVAESGAQPRTDGGGKDLLRTVEDPLRHKISDGALQQMLGIPAVQFDPLWNVHQEFH